MKILFLARRFYPQIGGVEKHVLELGKRLIQQGHQVIVITEESYDFIARSGDDEAISKRKKIATRFLRTVRNDRVETINGIEIIRISVGKDDRFKKFRIWSKLWKLREIIKEADVVHCHDVFFWYLPFRFFYSQKPVYTTFHGYESYPITQKAVIIRKLSEKLSWGNICIGDFIPKWYGTKPDYVSYGAVETRIKNQESRIKEKKDSALFFGRLDEQTGVLDYVRASELVKKQFPHFELLVIGEGKYKKQLEKKTNILGFQENPERYFKHYRFAFVSRYLSILEAFAAKRLVFALYDNPVKEDYLKMAPYAKWIIIENNPEKLAEKITYYLQHPEEEKKLIENAYEWVTKQSWDKMVTTYEKLWRK